MSRACRVAQTITLLLLLSVTAPIVHAQDTLAAPLQSGKPKKSTTAAVFMSLGLPGAGQFYTHQYVKGAVAIVAEGALLASISFNNDRMLGWRKSADNLNARAAQLPAADSLQAQSLRDLAGEKRANERFFRNQRNRLIWWMAGTLMLSMGDAYVDAQLFGLDFSPNITMSGRGVGLTVACKF